jgi:phosphoglycolate phosphatase-like HAD superfamily hydrolase
VLAENGLDRDRLAMVGDANSDLIGAREAGVRFVGRVRPGEPDPFAGENVPVVADMAELDRRWAELFE